MTTAEWPHTAIAGDGDPGSEVLCDDKMARGSGSLRAGSGCDSGGRDLDHSLPGGPTSGNCTVGGTYVRHECAHVFVAAEKNGA